MSNPYDVIRAKNQITGEHYTTTRVLAQKAGDRILGGHVAVDALGRWLPPKPAEPITVTVRRSAPKRTTRAKKKTTTPKETATPVATNPAEAVASVNTEE